MHAKIYKKDYGYQVHFQNKWYTVRDESEAKERASELNLEYFSENRNKLPKGITLDLPNKRFRFHVRLNNFENKCIKSSKDLDELIKMRKHLIKNLLELF